MSDDMIDRQAAINALADMHCKSDEDGYVWIIRSDAWARIDALSPAEPVQYGWVCPVCGRGLSPLTMVCPCNNGKGWEITCKT